MATVPSPVSLAAASKVFLFRPVIALHLVAFALAA
jgi:hypothetical protein